jgi:hypothetical protein
MVLTLWFYGDPGNAAAGDANQMYVSVIDDAGLYAELRYGDNEGQDMNDIKMAAWQRWDIPLTYFSDGNFAAEANDVNLADVNMLVIGFGERNGSQPGGFGYVWFDDIRLYSSSCRPDKIKPEGDLNNDCTVDFEDVEIMAGEWLESDVLVEVTEPCDANLLGWWKLDEGSGSTANDFSGKDHHGTLEILDVNVSWVSGHDANALEFSGGRVRVSDTPELRPTDEVSACAWIYYSEGQNSARVVVKGPDDFEAYDLEVNDYKLIFLVRDGGEMEDGKYKKYSTESTGDIDRDEWVHVAGTYDGNAVKCYINGEVAGTNNNANTLAFLSQDTNDLAIGNRSDDDEKPFEGMIDDVRVYDYGLSAEEVVWLATDGTGIFALQSIANLYNDEDPGERVVNLKDFAKLAVGWRDEIKWP